MMLADDATLETFDARRRRVRRKAPLRSLRVLELFAALATLGACSWNWDSLGVDAVTRSDATFDAQADVRSDVRVDVAAPSCGAPAQPCCENSECITEIATCVSGTCRACGRIGLPCCTGGVCDRNSNCGPDGLCIACGLRASVCCRGMVCEEGLTCSMQDGGFGALLCNCGLEGTHCCADTTCDPGLRCDATSLHCGR